jgi:hypothetical protein
MTDAESQLQSFMSRFSPEVAARGNEALSKLREFLPGATCLVYDNYNALAVAFTPDGRPSHAILSLTLYPRWVSLFFTSGGTLPDPAHLLKGSGNKMRHMVLVSAHALDQPEVRALIYEAVRSSGVQMPASHGQVIIQSVSAKQRPRRPT